MPETIVVFSSVPDETKGREIARALVEARLAACAKVSAPCASFYWWEGKLAEDREFILTIVTKASLFGELETKLKALHPYAVPEIIALPVTADSRDYLEWVEKETSSQLERPGRSKPIQTGKTPPD